MYTLSLDPADVDLDATHAFLSRTYWSEGLRRDIHERAVRNSLVCSALHADARGRRRICSNASRLRRLYRLH